MIIDKDIILTIVFAGIPFCVGWVIILNKIYEIYYNLLWNGVKHKCLLCGNIKEVKI